MLMLLLMLILSLIMMLVLFDVLWCGLTWIGLVCFVGVMWFWFWIPCLLCCWLDVFGFACNSWWLDLIFVDLILFCFDFELIWFELFLNLILNLMSVLLLIWSDVAVVVDVGSVWLALVCCELMLVLILNLILSVLIWFGFALVLSLVWLDLIWSGLLFTLIWFDLALACCDLTWFDLSLSWFNLVVLTRCCFWLWCWCLFCFVLDLSWFGLIWCWWWWWCWCWCWCLVELI